MFGGRDNEEIVSAQLSSLSVVAHELKSPLTLIRQLSLLLKEVDLSPEERRHYHDQLLLTTERAINLTYDLSSTGNLQPSMFPLEPVNPFAVCRAIQSDSIAMAELYNRQIRWPKSKKSILMVANHHLSRRVLMNFLENAMKYTEPAVPIEVSVGQLADKIRIKVRDYGPAMSMQEYRRILDQLAIRKTTKTRPESSGLGIFIASEFTKAMNGQIGLIRHRNGVTFFMELPTSHQMSYL